MKLSKDEQEEYDKLKEKFYACSLGDRPPAPSAETIRRLAELEAQLAWDCNVD